MAQQVTSVSPAVFAADAEAHLGHANGNIYQRSLGVDGVHDGQVMIRLKKHRFAVLDYSIVPNSADIQAEEAHAFVKLPKGAGKTKCVKPECNKVGVPVCLYDSEPGEPDSLYLRSGLCFLCQRTKNEDRRAERKRAPKEGEVGIIYALGSTGKKLKVSGETIPLKSDAIIMNGAVEGIRRSSESFQEIGPKLKTLAKEAAQATDQLVETATGNASESINLLYQKAFQSMYQSMFLLSQWKTSHDNSVPASASGPSAASAADSAPEIQCQQTVESLLVAADTETGTSNQQQHTDQMHAQDETQQQAEKAPITKKEGQTDEDSGLVAL